MHTYFRSQSISNSLELSLQLVRDSLEHSLQLLKDSLEYQLRALSFTQTRYILLKDLSYETARFPETNLTFITKIIEYISQVLLNNWIYIISNLVNEQIAISQRFNVIFIFKILCNTKRLTIALEQHGCGCQ